jgi:succinate dehydrogenase/fumarate reductase cytochrome b subunit
MLRKIQAASGAVFSLFLVVHLINTWIASVGAGAYDSVQQVLRQVYQFAPVEALILAALAVHMAVGITRIVTEPPRQLSLRARLHRYSGFFLMVFIGGHIFAVRGSSWFYGVYPGFEGLAFSIDAVPGYFYPYYFLLALAGLYHGLNGLGIASARLGWRLNVSSRVLQRVTAGGGFLTAMALLGFGGWFFEVGNVYESAFAQLAIELADGVLGVTIAP